MSLYLYYNCYIATFLVLCKSQWISSSKSLPRIDCGMAIGSYNQSIFYLGGYQNYRQLVEYDIARDEFIDVGETVVSALYLDQPYYTQIDHTLYVIDILDTLTTYNMKTNAFDPNYASINSKVNTLACLASKPGYLYIVGGFNKNSPSDLVQVFDITNHVWMTDSPPMNNGRQSPSCIVNPSTGILYAFGGYVYGAQALKDWIHSTEAIDTTDITQRTWSIKESLALNVSSYFYPVVHDNKIYVMGARISNPQGNPSYLYHDTMYIMDLITETLSISPDPLWDAIWGAAPIVVDDILYSFGGWNGGDNGAGQAYDYLKMYPLTTYNPSTTSQPVPSPTKPPQVATTANPSVIPSHTPSTGTPSKNPIAFTVDPSAFPTQLPSANPSQSPLNPTELPISSNDPSSANPSVIPSHTPSTGTPSKNPIAFTVDPSAFPTQLPSANPSQSPLNPTELPISSNDPSSANPSVIPFHAPSTGTPSNNPVAFTFDPSAFPTELPIPSNAPLGTSTAPTTIPSLYPITGTITRSTGESMASSDIQTTKYNKNIVDATDIDKEFKKNENELVALAGSIAAVLMIVVCVYLCIKYKKEAKRSKRLELFEMQKPEHKPKPRVDSMVETVEGVHDDKDACTMILQHGVDPCVALNIIIDKDSKNISEVKAWLANVVQMPDYYDTFIQNGYDSLDTIKQTKDNVELQKLESQISIIRQESLMKLQCYKVKKIIDSAMAVMVRQKANVELQNELHHFCVSNIINNVFVVIYHYSLVVRTKSHILVVMR
eukprot:1052123_1